MSKGGQVDSRRDVNAMLRPLMARVSQDVLQPEGFKPSTGFKHRREVGGMKQALTFFARLRAPYLHRRHHLMLRVDLYFPEFEDLVREMLPDDREPSYGLPTDAMRLEFGVVGSMWGFDSEVGANDLFEPVERMLRQAVLPWLDARRTPGALADTTLAGMEAERVPGSIDARGSHPIFAAAAALHAGRPEQAREIVELAYAEDIYLRRDNAKALERVRRP